MVDEVKLKMKSAKRKTEDFECKVRSFNIKLKIPSKVFKPNTDSLLFAKKIRIHPGEMVLEMGTGSGLIGIVAAKLGAGEITAVDINPHALACAKANAIVNRVIDKFRFIKSDLFSNIPRKKFDVVIFNPPFATSFLFAHKHPRKDKWYLAARAGGKTGNEIFFRFLDEVKGYCTKKTRIYTIITGAQQKEAAAKKIGKDFKIKTVGSDTLITIKETLVRNANAHRELIQKFKIPISIRANRFFFSLRLVELHIKKCKSDSSD